MCTYGDRTIELLSKNDLLFLEDEECSKRIKSDEYCPSFGPENIKPRLCRIKRIELKNNIRFKAVSIHVDDLISDNESAIADLNRHISSDIIRLCYNPGMLYLLLD